MSETEYLPNIANLDFVEGLYAEYLRDPSSVAPEWRRYFEKILKGNGDAERFRAGPSFRPPGLFNPSVEAGTDQNVNVGDTVSLDPATFTDPGGDDTHTATIDWDDGTVEPGTVNQTAGTVSGSHVYTAAGTYTVTITVTDDDGGETSDTFTVVVTGPDMYYNYIPAVYK